MVDWLRDEESGMQMATTKDSLTVGMEELDEVGENHAVVKSILKYSPDGDNRNSESLQRKSFFSGGTKTTTLPVRSGLSKISVNHNNNTTSPPIVTTGFTSATQRTGWKRKLRKKNLILDNAKKGNTTTTTTSTTVGTEEENYKYDNVITSTSGYGSGGSNWKSSLRWDSIPRHVFSSVSPPTSTTTRSSSTTETIIKRISRGMRENNGDKEQKTQRQPVVQRSLVARSVQKIATTTARNGGGEYGGILRGKRGKSSSSKSNFSALTAAEMEESPVATYGSGRKLMMSAAGAGGGGGAPGDSSDEGSDGEISSSSGGGIYPSSSGGPNYNNYIVGGEDVVDAGVVSKRLLDIHQISSRLHRSFPWEGLGLHRNATISAGSIGHAITDRIGFNPATTPHTLMFSSLYIVPLILLLGIVIALIWLVCACSYYTMKRIKYALCPGRARENGKKGKNGKGNNNSPSSNNPNGIEDGNGKPQILTPELIEMRRQERLAFLQAECANLEQQLTEEKSATLTSRASDSDLEYLGASESPPLKRNSISLQDIPQSVIRIRREKELRQIKEEIEYLRTIAQEEKEKVAQVAKALKGSRPLLTQEFEFELPGSKPGSPCDSKVEPLSQHISHLKTQRKLNEIRSELEDLAIQLLHADEIKAKRSSLQELPRTALNIQRENNLITMTSEIQKMKTYKLQKKNVIETALEKSNNVNGKGASGSTADSGKQAGSKSFNNHTRATPSKTEDVAAKYSDPDFVHRASIKRQREQELNRVRVELKDLAYKLNLNPMNYISEDRVKLVPSQSMQSTSSITGQSPYNKTASSSHALNHV